MEQTRRYSLRWRISNTLHYGLLLTLCLCGLSIITSLSDLEAVTMDIWRRLLFRINPATSEVYPEPAIDRTVRKDMDEIMKALPNLPLSYQESNNPHSQSGNNNCAPYPPLLDITFNNIYWQVLQTSNLTFYLFSAFYDNRTLSANKPSIRIISMINRFKPTLKIHCQIWYAHKTFPVISNVTEYRYLAGPYWVDYKGKDMEPYLLECAIPAEHSQQVPESVSLVEKSCDKPTNNLRIVNNQPADGQKKNFAVCVKGLDFTSVDLSVRIVEWLELIFLLGADKVFLYNLGIHPNISKVIHYYESLGRVDVKELTLPGLQTNLRGLLHTYLIGYPSRRRKSQAIAFNDCLYRNMNIYKFVKLIDIDEVIVPKTAGDWRSLMEQVDPRAMAADTHTRSSYCGRHVYFLDSMQDPHGHNQSIPPYLHMMQHVYRSAEYTNPGQFTKCFYNTERILTIWNHYALSCFDKCNALLMPIEHAQMHHYRKDCVIYIKDKCAFFRNHTVSDTRLWRYKERLIKNALYTFNQLGFLR